MEQLETQIYGIKCQIKFLLNAHDDLMEQQQKIIKYLDYMSTTMNENLTIIDNKIKKMDPFEKNWDNLI